MRAERRPVDRLLLAVAALALAGALALALLSPGAALTGWLAAASGFAALPAGGLVLMMMMRLIPGAWGEELRLSTEAATLLLPPAALLFLPVLIAIGAIYPWSGGTAGPAFRQAWLSPLPFILRSLLWFAALFWLGRRMRRRRATTASAAGGLVLVPLLGSAIGVDWLMSLKPDFASSAYGLQFLLLQVTIAFAALLLLRLPLGRPLRRPAVLGGLLLTLLLLWAYFQFLPFFIIWSGNLPAEVGWYADRSAPGWQAAAWLFGLLGGVPLFLLLFGPVRSGRTWLMTLATMVLCGKLVELGWLALPRRGPVAIAAGALAMAGMTALAALGLRLALRHRIRARMPKGTGA